MTIKLSLLGAVSLAVGAIFGGAPAFAQPIPPGSYQSSCENISTNDGMLRASCETEEGDLINSRLNDYSDCEGDISNADGRLTCTRGDENEDEDDQINNRVPPGSYQETCRNERVESGDLTAECADRNGRWRFSELQNHRLCRGDIRNGNGILSCNRNDDEDDNGYNLPGGSWRATCRDHHVSGNTLYAECRDRVGRWVETSVNLRNCRQGVSNVNGRLVCVQSSPLGWRLSLYKNAGYRGTGRTFIADIPDLARHGFANVASSAYLRAGSWQLCTRAYYRGRCVTLRFSAPYLQRLGINDQVRSLRRVR